MPTKVFIGNVSPKATEDDLKEAFGKYGKVVQHAIIRSFGFVHFENKEDAEKAIKELDDTELKGTVIKVELSKTPHKHGNWVHRDFPRRKYGNESQDRYQKRDYGDHYYYDDSYGYRERPAVPPPTRSRPYGRPYNQTYSYRELPPSSSDRSRYYEDYYYKYGRSQYDKPASYYSDYYSYSSQPRSYPTSSSSTYSSSSQTSYGASNVTYTAVASNTTVGATTTSHSTTVQQ